MSNQLWRLEPGWLAGYTEDRKLIGRIRRYKDWAVMADYYKNNRFIGCQYKIPIEQRRAAERMFNVTDFKENKPI
ncbi:hypothetical protein ACT8ZR_15785 [Neobacillus sp. M.A.Huq-85]